MPAGFIAIGGMLGGGMLTGIVASAVVGAAIGGLSAAVMGGDIGKGMLFGAIGGVVTGGIAGGGISNMFSQSASYLSGSSGSMFGAGQSLTALGEGGGVIASSASSAVTTAATTGGAKAFGGILNSKFLEGAAGPLMGAAGKLFQKEKYDPNTDLDWLRENREDQQAHDLATIRASGGRGGGGGGGGSDVPHLELERLRQAGALNQISAEAAEHRKALGIQGDQALKQQNQEYTLANSNAQKEWDRGIGKLKDAANVASSGQYQSGEGAYEAVKAAQESGGDAQPSRGALMGYPTEATA